MNLPDHHRISFEAPLPSQRDVLVDRNNIGHIWKATRTDEIPNGYIFHFTPDKTFVQQYGTESFGPIQKSIHRVESWILEHATEVVTQLENIRNWPDPETIPMSFGEPRDSGPAYFGSQECDILFQNVIIGSLICRRNRKWIALIRDHPEGQFLLCKSSCLQSAQRSARREYAKIWKGTISS